MANPTSTTGLSPEDLEDIRREKATEAFSSLPEPKPHSWGICLGGDAPAVIGGQFMMFLWWDARHQMIATLREHLVPWFLPLCGFDMEAAEADTATLLDAFAEHGDAERLRADLGSRLVGHVRIDWIGPLAALATGDTAFARDIRADFRAEDDGLTGIADADLPTFARFLGEWTQGG